MLRNRLSVFTTVACAALITFATGCGSGSSASTTDKDVPVNGVVKYHGTPVKHGEVVFESTNAAGEVIDTHSASISSDGTYIIDAKVGENRVHIKTPELARAHIPSQEEHFKVKANPGENNFNIDIETAHKSAHKPLH